MIYFNGTIDLVLLPLTFIIDYASTVDMYM